MHQKFNLGDFLIGLASVTTVKRGSQYLNEIDIPTENGIVKGYIPCDRIDNREKVIVLDASKLEGFCQDKGSGILLPKNIAIEQGIDYQALPQATYMLRTIYIGRPFKGTIAQLMRNEKRDRPIDIPLDNLDMLPEAID